MSHPNSLKNKTILITGGAGFIGSHIAAALMQANEVRVLDNLSTGTKANVPGDVDFIEGDIRNERALSEAMDSVDIVFHEAALVSVDQSIQNPPRSHEINERGTLNVLEQARKQDARVVFASSAAIYGHPETVPISESAPKEPISPYGIEKLAADQFVRRYNELYDLPTVSLRYFNVYGPRQSASDYSGVISIFRQQAKQGESLTVHGDGSQTRDFVHVSDVVQANLLAAETDAVGEAFNIGTGNETSIRELAETIQQIYGGTSPIEYTEARDGDIQQSHADISKAKRVLDYEATVADFSGLSTHQ